MKKKCPIRAEEWAAQLGEYFQSAILAEREECAKIAEYGILNPDGKEGTNLYVNPYSSHRKAIAKAIRARSQSPNAPQSSNGLN